MKPLNLRHAFNFPPYVILLQCLSVWVPNAYAQDMPAFEEIVTGGDADSICKPQTEMRRVDPLLLSELILRRLGLTLNVIFEIAGRNPHIPPAELPRALLLDANVGDPMFVDIDFVDANSTITITNGRQIINDYISSEYSRVADVIYRVMPENMVITDDTATDARQAILRNDPSVWIACQAKSTRSFLDSDALKRLRLRGKLEDLTTKRPDMSGSASALGKFNGVDPAEFSLISNQKENQTTVAVSFVAGYAFDLTKEDEDNVGMIVSTYSVIPFVSYEQTNFRPDSEKNSDVHQITPGVQLAWNSNDRILGFVEETAVSLSTTFDEEQDARTLNAQATFNLNPTVTSTSSRGAEIRTSYCFSDYIIGGPVGIHCSPRAIADFRHVLDAGTSPDLQDDDDDQFLGLGGEIGLTLFLARTTAFDPGIFQNFSLDTSFRYLGIVAGSVESQKRFRVAVSYQFPTVRFLEWIVSYENGNNIQTLQDEELARLSLGVRF